MTQDSSAERRRKNMAVMDDKNGKGKIMTDELKRYAVAAEIENADGLYVCFADAMAHTQAAIAAALRGAVKPLEWYRESGESFAKADTGIYRVCSPNNSGLWMWFRYSSWPKSGCILGIGGEMHDDAFQDELTAKSAAQADYEARILSALSIPADATAALEAVKQKARDEVIAERDAKDVAIDRSLSTAGLPPSCDEIIAEMAAMIQLHPELAQDQAVSGLMPMGNDNGETTKKGGAE